MPRCSYKLEVNVVSDSFIGEHTEVESVEYFAKGYAAWLGLLQALDNKKDAYSIFVKRYKKQINYLADRGFISSDPKVNNVIDSHIEEEWGHFINGIYSQNIKTYIHNFEGCFTHQ